TNIERQLNFVAHRQPPGRNGVEKWRGRRVLADEPYFRACERDECGQCLLNRLAFDVVRVVENERDTVRIANDRGKKSLGKSGLVFAVIVGEQRQIARGRNLLLDRGGKTGIKER